MGVRLAVGAVTPEQELWSVALWVEKHHGTGGNDYIDQQIERLAAEGDEAGVAMWNQVRERFGALFGRGMNGPN